MRASGRARRSAPRRRSSAEPCRIPRSYVYEGQECTYPVGLDLLMAAYLQCSTATARPEYSREPRGGLDAVRLVNDPALNRAGYRVHVCLKVKSATLLLCVICSGLAHTLHSYCYESPVAHAHTRAGDGSPERARSPLSRARERVQPRGVARHRARRPTRSSPATVAIDGSTVTASFARAF